MLHIISLIKWLHGMTLSHSISTLLYHLSSSPSPHLPESSSSLSLSLSFLSFFPSFASFCNIRPEGCRSKTFHCLLISSTARPRDCVFFPWLAKWRCEMLDFVPLYKKCNLLPAVPAPCTQLLNALQQPQDYSQELLYDPKYFFIPPPPPSPT